VRFMRDPEVGGRWVTVDGPKDTQDDTIIGGVRSEQARLFLLRPTAMRAIVRCVVLMTLDRSPASGRSCHETPPRHRHVGCAADLPAARRLCICRQGAVLRAD